MDNMTPDFEEIYGKIKREKQKIRRAYKSRVQESYPPYRGRACGL